MKKFKIKLWLTLTIIGLIGVASLLLSDIPLDILPEEVTELIPPETLRYLLLINPTIFLIITTTIGTLVYDKVNLSVPIIEKLLGKPDYNSFSLQPLITQSLFLGLIAGVLILLVAKLFYPYLPQELTVLNQADPNIVTKILYGGITEELITRFGLMSLFVWIIFKITKQLTAWVYWTGIVLAAVIFALGHLPIVFQIVAQPTLATYSYIILGNSIGGVIFGYAYYKKGLESAVLVHAFAHITMITLTSIIS